MIEVDLNHKTEWIIAVIFMFNNGKKYLSLINV